MCCLAGCHSEAIDKLYAPLEVYRRKQGQFYHKHPQGARALFVSTSAFVGMIQPIIFPLESLVYSIAIPLVFPLYKYFTKQGDPKDWLKAWAFSVLGVALSLTFMGVSAFYLTLFHSALIYVGAVCISITIHVYRACKDPNPIPIAPRVIPMCV